MTILSLKVWSLGTKNGLNLAMSLPGWDQMAVDNLAIDNLAVDNLAIDNLAVDNLAIDNLAVNNWWIRRHQTIQFSGILRAICAFCISICVILFSLKGLSDPQHLPVLLSTTCPGMTPARHQLQSMLLLTQSDRHRTIPNKPIPLWTWPMRRLNQRLPYQNGLKWEWPICRQ
jgi:hypothetical protein